MATIKYDELWQDMKYHSDLEQKMVRKMRTAGSMKLGLLADLYSDCDPAEKYGLYRIFFMDFAVAYHLVKQDDELKSSETKGNILDEIEDDF